MTGRIVDHQAARRAALVASIWVPLAIVIASEAVVIGVGASGSPRLITHWGGGADRTGPWWVYAVIIAAIGVPVIAFMGFFIARATRMAGMNPWMSALALGLTIFHCLGMGVGSVVLNASRLAPALPLAGGAVLGILGALLTWWLLPRETPTTTSMAPAEPLPVKPGEVAVWTGRVELPAWFISLVAGIAAVFVAFGLGLFLAAGPHVWPVFFVVAAMLLAVLLATGQFDVSVGPRGFFARSALGWPRLSIPTAELAGAGIIQVDPLADFGGWGLRWVTGPHGKGRRGIITRRGPGLEVFRRDGRSIVVTIDDPGTAAAVLGTYAQNQA